MPQQHAPPSPPARSPEDRAAVLVLAALMLVGAALRLVYIADEGFWFDEFIIRWQARMSLSAMMDDMILNDVHPPLYQLVMQGWVRLTGRADELWLRLPSALFGVLTLPVVFGLGRALFDRRVGLWAAGVLALSEFAIYYSQEARAYSLLLLLSAATVWAWVALLRRADARRLLVYGLCGLAAAYTHAFGLLLLVYLTLCYAALWMRGRHGALSPARWLSVHVAMGLAYLPWLPSFFAQHERVQGGFWIPEPGWLFFTEYFAKYTGHRWLGVLAALLLAFLGWQLWRGRVTAAPPPGTDPEDPVRAVPSDQTRVRPLARVGFLVGWFVFLLGVPFVMSKIGQPIMHDKSAISVLVPLALALGLALEQLPARGLRTAVALVWVAGSLTAIVLTNYRAQNREAWREMSHAVAARMGEGDLVVLYHPDYDYMACYRYYLEPALAPGVEPIEVLCDGREACADDVAAIEARARATGAARLWLLKVRASEAFPAGLEAHWRVAASEPFNNGVLQILERRD